MNMFLSGAVIDVSEFSRFLVFFGCTVKLWGIFVCFVRFVYLYLSLLIRFTVHI